MNLILTQSLLCELDSIASMSSLGTKCGGRSFMGIRWSIRPAGTYLQRVSITRSGKHGGIAGKML